MGVDGVEIVYFGVRKRDDVRLEVDVRIRIVRRYYDGFVVVVGYGEFDVWGEFGIFVIDGLVYCRFVVVVIVKEWVVVRVGD